jgi:Lipid A 3-O-deacylase (PagL)
MKRGKFKSYFLLLIFPLCFATLFAQNGKGVSLEGTFNYGKIIKHHEFLRFDVPARSLGFDLNLTFQTYGKQAWNELHNYPIFGIALFYYNFGDKEVLGDAIGLCPNLTIYFSRSPKLDIHGQIGAGPAYLNKPFDRLNNPDNNAIGSNLNFNIYFRFYVKWKLNPQWALNAGFSLTHYSNAAAEVPNYGINIPALFIGTKFTPKPLKSEDYIQHGTVKKPDKKYGVNLHAGVAFKEIKAVGGPLYPIYSITVAGMYYLNKTNRVSLGLEYEYNKAAYVFGKHVYAFNSENEAKKNANRIMLFAADEFLFGHIGLKIQMGFYLTKDPILAPFPIYNKWGFLYYFSKFGTSNTQIYVGTQVKTHLYIADYISLDLGVTF